MGDHVGAKTLVVILGAGFGGLEAAKKLGGEDVRVTVIDRTNYHLFQPLLIRSRPGAFAGRHRAPVRAVLSKFKNMELFWLKFNRSM